MYFFGAMRQVLMHINAHGMSSGNGDDGEMTKARFHVASDEL